MTTSVDGLISALVDTGNEMMGVLLSTVQTVSDGSPSLEVGQTAAGVASLVADVGNKLTDSGTAAYISTYLGVGTAASVAHYSLPSQVRDLSSSISSYQDAVASGDEGKISSSGLSMEANVAAVVNSVGSIMSGVAGGMAGLGLISEAAAAALVSAGLAISSAAGLFALTATNAVVNAVMDAANAISNLLNDVVSQSGTGADINSGSNREGGSASGGSGSFGSAQVGAGTGSTVGGGGSASSGATDSGSSDGGGGSASSGSLGSGSSDGGDFGSTQVGGGSTTASSGTGGLGSAGAGGGTGSGDAGVGSGSGGSGTGSKSGSGGSPESGAPGAALGKYDDSTPLISPLVLDLTGSGINLTPLNTSSPYFDLTNDGFARQTGWIGSGTGLLCFDPNDQNITNITQLFGNATTDGFDILRQLDTNHDNFINTSDAAFESLRIWADTNGNAATDPGELYTLDQLGIVSINLKATAVNETIAGNKISSISSYTLTDGTTREIADAWFANSPTNTRQVTPVVVSTSAAALPQLSGAGTMRDLRSAMTLDQKLQVLVQAFVAQPSGTSPTAVKSAVQAILFEWAGVTNVSSSSRGPNIDARQLEFVEQYLGRPFVCINGDTNPESRSGAIIQLAWNDLYDASFARLVLQSPLAVSIAPEFRYDATSDTVQAAATFAPALAAAYQRLGAITAANLASWDVVLRVADAARFDMGMSISMFEEYVAVATNDTIASVASAIVSGVQISVTSSGQIQETGETIYHEFYAGPGVSLLSSRNAGGDSSNTALWAHDTFIYAAGDGVVEIQELDSHASGATLRFRPGIDPSSVTVKSSGSNSKLVLTDGIAGDQITLDSEMDTANNDGVQQVQFADGTSWDRQQLIQMAATGTTGNDTLYGTSDADIFDGRGGNDIEYGYGGGDTFIFNPGYGTLEISELSGGTNVLKLGTGINASSVSVQSTSIGIVLTDGIGGDQITLDGERDTANNGGLQQVQFADGTSWDRQQLIQMATQGTTDNDTLYGTSGAEVFDGKGGNDTVWGYGGNDVYSLQQGYGALTIYTGNSSTPSGELLIKNADPDEIWLQRVGNNLQVDIMGTKTEGTIENWFSYSYGQLGEIAVSGGVAGNMVLDTQVNQLIQAMATFTANHAGFDPTSSSNPMITDPTVLAAVSSSWHH